MAHSMRVSSMNFHFESAPLFTARSYGSSRWIEVSGPTDRGGADLSFAIFVDKGQSFDELSIIADALTAAWSSCRPTGDQQAT